MSFSPWPHRSDHADSRPARANRESDAIRGPAGPWHEAAIRGASALGDTLHAGNHTRDFSLARTEYLRNRLLVCGVIFALLTPLWLIVDTLLLPASTLAFIMPGRFFLLGGLIATLFLAYHAKGRPLRARLAAGLLIALPAAFYGLMLLSLPPGQVHLLVGYSFIPYLLVAVLSIFPFTLSESLFAGLAMLTLEWLAQERAGIWLTPAGWQGLWLLGVLLAISLTANHFHLSLLLRLYRQATHDPLTGLFNRRALHQALRQLRERHPERILGLMMVDIDHFKRLNDEHGHAFGDHVLWRIARQLEDLVREAGGVAARYGGEEFLLVLPGAQPDVLARHAESLRRQVEHMRLLDYDGQPVSITISVGLAALRPDETAEQALRQADARLYRAKAAGRNQVMTA